MALVRWNPTRDLAGMEIDRLNQMFDNLYGEAFQRGWVPAVDVFETGDHELVLKAELPDMKREDIQVVFENNTLTLKGERKFEGEIKQEQFHRVERAYGTFSRSFSLPSTVDATKIAAEYKNGVLTITLPFREESKPRTINVEVAA